MAVDLSHVQVVGLGQASLDYLGRIPVFPVEDAKVELDDLQPQCGGPASTALVTLSRLGVKTSFLGSVSDDNMGMDIQNGLEAEGVDATFLKITPGYTSQYAFIAITRDSGKRTIFWHRGTVPPLGPGEIDMKPYSGARILHLDGLMIEASLEAARQAKNQGLKVVMDAGTMREGSLKLVSMVDVLIASERFAAPLTGEKTSVENALAAISKFAPGEVVITRGKKGSIGLRNNRMTRQRAYPVNELDTTGAGDVYHGAYIYGLLKKWDMKDCMRFASAASAIKCTEIGARKGIPNLDQVKDFIARHADI